jgi:transcriptional regulator with XRE-family HTH domain
MVVGDRLKTLREAKDLSQGDIEKRTGLLRCYVSRVENGHTVPSVETLEKFARALEIPFYHLMYDGDKPPTPPKIGETSKEKNSLENSRSGVRLMRRLVPLLAKMDQRDRQLILLLAGKASQRNKPKASKG